jgi:hypothetical protein
MQAKYLSQPCHNYCLLANILIPADPKDGREKYVLSTFAAGGTGRIILIDTQTETGETLELPGDEGAWALYFLEETGELLVGTCANYGYLHRLDMKTRTWAKPLRLEGETYIWNFARGKDGCIYGSNYPGCILVKYDPETQTLSNAGRVCPEENNHYSRFIYTNADGNIIGSAGFDVLKMYYYDVDKKEFKIFGEIGDAVLSVGEDYIFAQNGDYYKFYDPFSLELMEPVISKDALDDLSMIQHESARKKLTEVKNPPYIDKVPGKTGGGFHKLSDGRVIGTQGQEYIMIDGDDVDIKRIPADPPATTIMTVAVDAEGIVWGSCGFGQTIFFYDPKTGKYENTVQVTKAGGEVYGICPKDGKIFLSSYVGGDHMVYDPKKPWNHHDNVNPRTLESVRPLMTRPMGKSVIGPDGNFFTGWCAAYGVYGGGVSRINTQTYELASWYQIIPQQSIRSIASSKTYLYAVTCGGTSGLPTRKDSFHILRMDCDCNIVWKKQYELGIVFTKVIVAGNFVLAGYVNNNTGKVGIYVFREDTMEELPSIELGDYDKNDQEGTNFPTDAIAYDDNTIVIFIGKRACLMQIPDGNILKECPIEGFVRTSAKGEDGKVYFAINSKLYVLEF